VHSRRTVAAVEFPPESAGYDSDRIHCMTCRTTITTPSLRAVVSLTPSLRIMITTPSNSNINTLTVNLQQVCTQLRWTPFTGKVNTMKEQNHPFVFFDATNSSNQGATSPSIAAGFFKSREIFEDPGNCKLAHPGCIRIEGSPAPSLLRLLACIRRYCSQIHILRPRCSRL
jgi:hypothetical protein